MIDRACISLTDACNLRCRYCHFRDKQRAGTAMSCEDAVAVINEINAYCQERGVATFKVGVVGSGEPLLELDSIIAMVEAVETNPLKAITFYTITNGTLATRTALGRLYPHRELMRVCFSLDGPEQIHNAGRTQFTRAMRGIANYRDIYGEAPAVNATVNLQTILYSKEVIRFFKNKGLVDVTFSRLVDCYDSDLAITQEQFDDFMTYAKSQGLASRQFRGTQSYDCTMYGKLCGVGRTNIFITPVGIYPCGRFYRNEAYRLGDLNTPLTEIEERCSLIQPVGDGKCFFDERVMA